MTRTVGGTMVSRILGLSRWGGPLSAYFSLIGQDDGAQRNSAMSRGVALEESVLVLLQERDELPVVRPPHARIGPEEYPGLERAMPHAHATLDAVRTSLPCDRHCVWTIVDAKTASREDMGEDWGLDGTDRIPAEYHLQLLWYHGVCRAAGMHVAEEALLPTLVGPEVELQWTAKLVTKLGRPLALADLEGTGLELRVYHVVWDAALFAEVDARVRRFLEEHVAHRRPPEPGPGDVLTDWDVRAVSRGLRAEPGRVLDFERMAPPEQALVLELLEATRQRKAWEKAKKQTEARVKLAMGTADEVRGLPGGAWVSWKGTSGPTGKRRFQVHEPRRK